MDRSAEVSLLVRVDSDCIHETRMVRRRQRRRVRDNTGPLYSALSNEQTAESDITLHTASDALWNSALHRIVPPVELEVPMEHCVHTQSSEPASAKKASDHPGPCSPVRSPQRGCLDMSVRLPSYMKILSRSAPPSPLRRLDLCRCAFGVLKSVHRSTGPKCTSFYRDQAFPFHPQGWL